MADGFADDSVDPRALRQLVRAVKMLHVVEGNLGCAQSHGGKARHAEARGIPERTFQGVFARSPLPDRTIGNRLREPGSTSRVRGPHRRKTCLRLRAGDRWREM